MCLKHSQPWDMKIVITQKKDPNMFYSFYVFFPLLGRYSSTKAFCIAFVLTFFNTFDDLPVAFQALIIFLYLVIVMIRMCWFIFLSEMSSNFLWETGMLNNFIFIITCYLALASWPRSLQYPFCFFQHTKKRRNLQLNLKPFFQKFESCR